MFSIQPQSLTALVLIAGNSHILSAPLDISGEDLWISIAFNHGQTERVMGCDPGPAANNGDWFYDDSVQDWRKFSVVTNPTISVNWNIRGIISQ